VSIRYSEQIYFSKQASGHEPTGQLKKGRLFQPPFF
jgi:hypothetical protein